MRHECDFCSEEPVGEGAYIYPAADITDSELRIVFVGSWLACMTCSAFIRQYDSGQDTKARDNLARRALEKYRRKYGILGVGIPAGVMNKVLMVEIKALHEKFWDNRQGEPVPYTTNNLLEGAS